MTLGESIILGIRERDFDTSRRNGAWGGFANRESNATSHDLCLGVCPPCRSYMRFLMIFPCEGARMNTSQLQLEYWTAFKEHLLKHKSLVRAGNPPALNYWRLSAVGNPAFHLYAAMNTRKGEITASLVIHGPLHQAHYAQLERQRPTIEARLAKKLIWSPHDKSSDINWTEHFDPFRTEQWSEQHEWLRTMLEKFHQFFLPIVDRLTNQARLQR
jgi:hypothetical protein